MAFCCIPERYVLVLMAHYGFFVVYSIRVNMSVAIVAMVNATYTHVRVDPECSTNGNATVPSNNGQFNWNQNEQGVILSSFFYGYLITQIPGGWLASRFGGKHVFGFGVLVTTVLSFLTPTAARASIYWLVFVRVLDGCGQGITVPAMHMMLGQWTPPQEVSRMTFVTFSGFESGTIFALLASGLLASSTFLGGWPSSFYVLGVVGLLWYVMWLFLVYDSPNDHPRIKLEEKQFILKSLNNKSSNASTARIPWSKIFTSLPVWAITIGQFSFLWVFYMVLTGLPLYFMQVLDTKLNDNGLLTALPFIGAFFTYSIAGVASDYLRKNYLSTAATRRLAGILGFYPASVFLILTSYAGCDEIGLSVAYMTLSIAFLSIDKVTVTANPLDISPRFSGILMALTNIAGTVAGCIAPSVTGYFTNDNPSREQYRKVFIVAAVISTVGGTFCNVFLSGVIQPWNDESNCSKPTDEQTPLLASTIINGDVEDKYQHC